MLEKFKNRKTENLILLLILLVITVLLMNNILKDEPKESSENKIAGATLAKQVSSIPTEEKLEGVLSKIEGVGEISILLTYNDEDLEGAVVVASGARKFKNKTSNH